MDRSFSNTLSQLRRDKGISQRVAATELGISQALLSHYENGAREPGLDFVCRACRYYDISADYLLCRCDEPDGAQGKVKAIKERIAQIREILDKAEAMLDDHLGGAQ